MSQKYENREDLEIDNIHEIDRSFKRNRKVEFPPQKVDPFIH